MAPRRSMTMSATIVATVAVGALAFAGCTATEEPATTATMTPATTAPEPSATIAAADDPACLVGDWTLDDDGFSAYYGQINDLLGGQAEFTPSGSATLTLAADGTFTWAPDATLAVDLMGQKAEVTIGGTLGGTYTAEPGHITTDPDVDDELEVSGTLNGSPFDTSAVSQQIASAPVNDSTFSCTTETLELTTAVDDDPVVTVLHRAS